MSHQLVVPPLGESVSEATVGRWLKQMGDSVKIDEPLVELETDKVTLEVNAPQAGILKQIAAPQGTIVKVGNILGQLDPEGAEEGKQIPQSVAAAQGFAMSPPSNSQNLQPEKKPQNYERTFSSEPTNMYSTSPTNAAVPPLPQQNTYYPQASPQPQSSFQEAPQAVSYQAFAQVDPVLSPAARKMADEQSINPQDVQGTGRDGRVTKDDIQQYQSSSPSSQGPSQPQPAVPVSSQTSVSQPPSSVSPSSAPSQFLATQNQNLTQPEERVRMTRFRQRIAERLKEAQNTAAMLTTFNEIDMSHVMATRDSYREKFEKRFGIKLGFMSFFVKATVSALKEIPSVNAEIENDYIIYKNHYDIGVAVSAPQGLVVPVVRDADHLNFAEIESRIGQLSEKARTGKLSMNDLTGGTFTITNGGVFGSLMSTPILNPPQSGILGMHKIQKRAVVIEDRVEIRPMMYVALTYDHRIIDGREAVTFLVRIKENIEDPQRILLGI